MKYAIIAAGEGSRLVEEGVKTPKPLVNINGETMIGRLIRIFTENNAESISIIVNQEMAEVKEYLDAVSCPVPLNLVVNSVLPQWTLCSAKMNSRRIYRLLKQITGWTA